MSNLMLVGGVHGVGKTTLIGTTLHNPFPGTTYFEPGALFERHLYQEKDRSAEEVEEMVTDRLTRKCRAHRLTVASWHWAVWQPAGYYPQISLEQWELVLRQSPTLEEVYLVNVTAPHEDVLRRRMRDYERHARKRDLAAIVKEAEESERFFKLFEERCYGIRNVTCAVINNVGIDTALYMFDNLYKLAYETAHTS